MHINDGLVCRVVFMVRGMDLCRCYLAARFLFSTFHSFHTETIQKNIQGSKTLCLLCFPSNLPKPLLIPVFVVLISPFGMKVNQLHLAVVREQRANRFHFFEDFPDIVLRVVLLSITATQDILRCFCPLSFT